MKIMPFSHEVCQELLNMGYSHFVIPNVQNKYNKFWNPDTALTFEAVRNRPLTKSVPIKLIMGLPEERARQYSVIVVN